MKFRYTKSIYCQSLKKKITADNQYNLGKWGKAKVHTHGVQIEGIVMFMHSSLQRANYENGLWIQQP